MTTIPQLVAVLQELLTSVADRIARATGFVRRESKMGGAEFSQTLVFGYCPSFDLMDFSGKANKGLSIDNCSKN